MTEYDVQETKDDQGVATVTCWIASEIGKVFNELPLYFAVFAVLKSLQRFTVNWMDSAVATATVTSVYVDGKWTRDGKVIRSGAINAKKRARGFRISDEELRPFIFSAIRLTGLSFLHGSKSSFPRQMTISILEAFPNILARFPSKSADALSDSQLQVSRQRWISQTRPSTNA